MVRATAANRSQAIREYLKKNKNARTKDIQAALKAQGVKVSEALLSKVKHHRSVKKKRGRKVSAKPTAKRARAANAETTNGAKVNKSAEIRNAVRELGKKALPREIVAALDAKGVKVSSAQVSTVRFNMKAKTAARKATTPSAPPRAKPTARSRTSGRISGQELIETKQLADQFGGIERLKQALDLLARLA